MGERMTAADRPRAWGSSLPARSAYMDRGTGLSRSRQPAPGDASSVPLRASTLTRQPWSRKVPAATGRDAVAALRTPPRRRDTIPPKVRKAVHGRDQRRCLHCGGWFPDGGIHIHHRRLKQAGGDPRPHTDCACNLVSLCWTCHGWFHDTEAGRAKAEAEGFIIPNVTPEPWRLSVLVHGEDDGSGIKAWPTCEGGRDGWVFTDPAGVAA